MNIQPRKSASAIFIFFLAILFSAGLFAIPQQINYRGKLMVSGSPVTGPQHIQFGIYSVAAGGTSLWSVDIPSLQVNNGIYEYTLGSGSAIPSSIFTNDFLYLETVVNTVVLSPRERLVTVPYAYKADMVRGANYFPSTGNVGIGTYNPIAPLSFSYTAGLGNKIFLWDHPTDKYGFAIKSHELQIFAAVNGGDIAFGKGDTTVFSETVRIKSNGNVGIGTSSPMAKLHVANGNVEVDFDRYIGGGTADFFSYDAKNIGNYSLGWYNDTWDGSGATAWFSGYTGIKFFTDKVMRMVINRAGNVGIGGNPSIYKLDVKTSSAGTSYGMNIESAAPGGFASFGLNVKTLSPTVNYQLVLNNSSANTWSFSFNPSDSALQIVNNNSTPLGVYIAWNSQAWAAASDRSLKKDIKSMSNVLVSLMKIPAITYRLKTQSSSDPLSIGFIAQDVQPFFPELVVTGDQGKLGLTYDRFGVLAIRGLQELKNEKDLEIETLKKENALLKSRLDKIEKKLGI